MVQDLALMVREQVLAQMERDLTLMEQDPALKIGMEQV